MVAGWLCSEIATLSQFPSPVRAPSLSRHSALPLPWLSRALLILVAVAVFRGGAAHKANSELCVANSSFFKRDFGFGCEPISKNQAAVET